MAFGQRNFLHELRLLPPFEDEQDSLEDKLVNNTKLFHRPLPMRSTTPQKWVVKVNSKRHRTYESGYLFVDVNIVARDFLVRSGMTNFFRESILLLNSIVQTAYRELALSMKIVFVGKCFDHTESRQRISWCDFTMQLRNAGCLARDLDIVWLEEPLAVNSSDFMPSVSEFVVKYLVPRDNNVRILANAGATAVQILEDSKNETNWAFVGSESHDFFKSMNNPCVTNKTIRIRSAVYGGFKFVAHKDRLMDSITNKVD